MSRPSATTPIAVALVALVALATSGCRYGYRQLRGGHSEYNAALKQTADSELLLNIVRLRYLDTMEFMNTSSISSQLSFTVSAGGQFGTFMGESQYLGIPNVEYSTRPTFTFTPQRGRAFAARLLEPVEVEDLVYLMATDWDPELLLRVFARGMNDLDNEIDRPSPEFRQAARHIGQLWLRGDLDFGFVTQTRHVSDPIDASRVSGSDLVEAAQSGYEFRRASTAGRLVLTSSTSQPVMAIRDHASPEGRAILDALELDPALPYYPLQLGTRVREEATEHSTITIRMRSLMNMITFLSLAVEVPEQHLEAGITSAQWPPGSPGQSIADALRIRSSTTKPNAPFSVRYRGQWFYVADNDMTSKMTFFVMAEIFRLQLSEVEDDKGPVLTLDVGQ